MSSQSTKSENERSAFLQFAERLGELGDWLSVDSREPSQPDLLCVHASNGPIAFELVRITDSSIAKVQAAGAKATQGAFWTSDPSERIVKEKLKKKYVTPHPVELLVYTEGQVITPDDAIVSTISPLLDAISHPFRRVWFMGEVGVQCLWGLPGIEPSASKDSPPRCYQPILKDAKRRRIDPCFQKQ